MPDTKPKQDPQEQKAKQHFREHAKAITTATTRIGQLNEQMKNAAPNDRDGLHREMNTQVQQLHLAVNNAANVPDDEDNVENTGGAASTDAVDPNAAKSAA